MDALVIHWGFLLFVSFPFIFLRYSGLAPSSLLIIHLYPHYSPSILPAYVHIYMVSRVLVLLPTTLNNTLPIIICLQNLMKVLTSLGVSLVISSKDLLCSQHSTQAKGNYKG